MMKKPLLIVVFAAFLAPLPVLADQHEDQAPAPLTNVWLIVPKADKEAEFAEAAAAEILARKKAGETRDWQAYRQVVGDNLRVVHYRSCCFNWADEDAAVAEEEKLGLSDSWNENVGPYVDHYHHYFERADWENSHWPDEGTGGPLYGVTSWTLKLGVGPGPEEARKKLSQTGLNGGWATDDTNWLWFTRIGGEPTLAIVSSYEDYADMEPPEQSFFEFVGEKLGAEEAAALFAEFGSGMASSDYTVWQLDESLSSPASDDE